MDNGWGGAPRSSPDQTFANNPNAFSSSKAERFATGNALPNMSDKDLDKHFRDERFFPYFGYANKIIAPNTYKHMDEENYVLPDAYAGSNAHTKNVIISQINEVDTWGTTIAFPLSKMETGMTISWDEWTFNDTMATRTPEEAVSRLQSSHFDSRSASMVRFGLAFITEHGFWKTDKGRTHYALQLIQIRNAIVNSAQLGATLAWLNPPVYHDDNEKYTARSHSMSVNELKRMFQQVVDETFILNKQEDGFQILLGKKDAVLKNRNGSTGDLILMPSGSASMVSQRPENKWHFLSGGINTGDKKFDIKTLQAGGRMVVESIMHKMGEHQPNQDPCYRMVVTGSYFLMNDRHLQGVDDKDRRTAMEDVKIYCEDNDDFYVIAKYIACKSMGLYYGWDTATKVGDMPVTELGKKIWSNVKSWGQLYLATGRLDRFIKQLNEKDNTVYLDFLSKFLNQDPMDDSADAAAARAAEAAAPARESYADAYAEGKNDEEDEAPTGAAVDFSGAFSELQLDDSDFPENDQKHRHRLQVLYNHLLTLDQFALKNGFPKRTILYKTVSSAVEKEKQTILSRARGADATAVLFGRAWEFAQEEIIAYDLQASLYRASKQNALTALETYVAKKSATKSFSRLEDKDEKKMSELDSQSPSWNPSGEALMENEVELIAPEEYAGDANTNIKRLRHDSYALTLASNFLVLFNIPTAAVERMIAASSNDISKNSNKTLFNLSLNWNKNMGNKTQLLERMGMLQISIILSAFYATLEAKHNSAAEISHRAIAEDWIKLAVPVHMITGSTGGFKGCIEKARTLYPLNYQGSIDTLILELRSALLAIFDAKQAGAKVDPEEIVHLVKGAEVLFVHTKLGNHARSAGATDINEVSAAGGQSQPGAAPLLGIDEPYQSALHSSSGWMATYHHTRREPVRQATTEQKVARHDKIKPLMKKLKEFQARLKKPGALGPIKPPHHDSSLAWKATHLKLMEEINPDAFANVYLPVNEDLVNYRNNDAAYRDHVLGLADKASATVLKAVASTLNVNVAGGSAKIEAIVKEAIVKAKASPLLFKPTPNTLAHEWTRLWSTNYTEMVAADKEITTANGGKRYADLDTHDVYIPIAVITYLLSQYDRFKLREVVGKFLGENKVSTSRFNPAHPMLFDLEDEDASGDKEKHAVVEIENESGGKIKRISHDLMRTYLLEHATIEDGYFWKWCMENNMIPAIGARGFKPHIVHEAGTMGIMSAFGKTGKTFYGHANMMLSDNAATKMHYGHFTYYSKSVVLNARNIVHGRNCISKEYHGGNGHRIWDATSQNDLEDYNAGQITKDIFIVPVLITDEVDTPYLDITGKWNSDIGAGEEAQKATHYDSAAIYSEYWGWRNNMENLRDNSYNAVRNPRFNTLCIQAHTGLYNHKTGNHDLVVLDKGFWGDRVYPGCGRVRRGLATYLKPVKWDGTNTIGFVV